MEVILSRMHLDDGTIVILDSKKGRDGWVIYRLPDVVYEALWNFQESTNSKEKPNNDLTETEQKLNNHPTQHPTQSITPVPSSSSINKDLIKTTTTEPKEEVALDEAWSVVDTSYLDEFGFSGRNLISQVARSGKLTPQQMQDSIKHFAFDLKKNNKGATIKGDKVAYFLAVLKRGEIYNAPSNYEDPADEKLRIYIENLKEQTKKREKLKETLKTAAFDAWLSSLAEEDKQRIAPCRRPDSAIERGNQTSKLSEHFDENYWPALHEKVWVQVNAQMGSQNPFKTNVDGLGQGREVA